MATLRAACSFLGISGSGSKLKVYTKILNHNKKMELLNAVKQKLRRLERH